MIEMLEYVNICHHCIIEDYGRRKLIVRNENSSASSKSAPGEQKALFRHDLIEI